MQFKTLLTPVDFSERTKSSLGFAFNLAQHFDSKVVVFHCVPVTRYPAIREGIYAPKESAELSADLEQHVREQTDALVHAVVPRKTIKKIIEMGGNPAGSIGKCAERKSADLIVMPTRGLGHFRRFLLGSVTSKVLDDAQCPVFTGAHLDTVPLNRSHSVKSVVPSTSAPIASVSCAGPRNSRIRSTRR